MKNIQILLFVLLLWGCNSSEEAPLQLKIVNESLFSYEASKDTINIIRYEISNTSDDTFYFNNMVESDSLRLRGVYKEGRSLRIFEGNGSEVQYKTIPEEKYDDGYINVSLKKMKLESKSLRYRDIPRFLYGKDTYHNFVIHPNETLSFEYYINITDTIPLQNARRGYPILKNGKDYSVMLSLASDTTNWKNNLPRETVKTITDNKYKAYHGVLSSEKIPLQMLK